MSEKAGRYQRSAAGMIGAMVVLVLIVLGFVVFRDLNRNEPQSPVRPVDYQETLGFAQDAVGFELLAPPSLPEGWRATSASFVPDPPRWHLGVLTDQDRYVGLEQSRGSVDTMVETYVDRAATKGEVVRIEGEPWQSWTDEGGDTALTRQEGGVTTLVVGTPDREVLVDYVTSLR